MAKRIDMKILLLTLITCALFSSEEPPESKCPAPWFTGPLITPTPHVVPLGYLDFESYLFYEATTGRYNNDGKAIRTPLFNKILLNPLVRVGITESIDMLILPNISWQESQGAYENTFDDFVLGAGYQVIHDTKNNTSHSIKIYAQEAFPTGKFDRLSPENFGTDQGGKGSYQTTLGFVLGRLYESDDCHFLSLRCSFSTTIPSKVNVRGINAFGGAADTKARVKLGQTYVGEFGLEYSLTQNWAFAFDAEVYYQRPTTFKGFPGTLPNGSLAPLGRREGFQFSIAPAIEYNFSESLGIIAGAWFTLTGRNQPRFISGIIALNYFGPKEKGAANKYRTSGGLGGAGGGGH